MTWGESFALLLGAGDAAGKQKQQQKILQPPGTLMHAMFVIPRVNSPSSGASATGLIPIACLLCVVGRLLLGEHRLPSIALHLLLLLFHHSLLVRHSERPRCFMDTPAHGCCLTPQSLEDDWSRSPTALPTPATLHGDF